MSCSIKHKETTCTDLRANCRAWCCRFLILKYDPNGAPDDLFISLRGMKKLPNGDIMIPARCRWLRTDYRCKIYSARPRSCQIWECDELKKLRELRNHGKEKEDVGAAETVFRKTKNQACGIFT